MNTPRKLKQNAWYKVGTEVNTGEPLFRLPEAKVLLHRVLRETKERYDFEMRGLRLEGAWLTFYIKPDDGLKLPLIMQWLKQTFSARLNARTGRTGHVWGERYDSEILPGRAARGGGGGGLGGGGKVGENEDTGGYSLHLVLGQPPLGRDDDNDEFFGPKRFQTRIPARLTAPDHGQKGVTYSFNHVAIDGYKENSAQHATRGFETVFFYK